MYEHTCLDCGEIWYSHKILGDGCPDCHEENTHTVYVD